MLGTTRRYFSCYTFQGMTPSLKPRVFVGSSSEGKDMVDEIVIGLEDVAACTPWPMAFPLTKSTLESLLKVFRRHDMAIFVFSPDDDAVIREHAYKVVRDNVLFE